jgi:hypothetical protein
VLALVNLPPSVNRTGLSNAIGYAMHSSRSYRAVIRVSDEAGNVIETHEHAFSSEVMELVVSRSSSRELS